MSNYISHPYHLVDESPWPFLSGIFGLGLTSGIVKWFYLNSLYLFFIRLVFLFFVSFQWWRDISRESTFQGKHTIIVEIGIKWGIGLFIISEIFFFLSFFWAFFNRRLSPNLELGSIWPPFGVTPFNAFEVPLLNTIILISSGIRVTWAHYAVLNNDFRQTRLRLLLTIILGVYFTLLQIIEYAESSFSISDSCYGATFFIATGFHGLHVIIGTIFLSVCYYRHSKSYFRRLHHFGLQAAIWYWHFVDVVWLFLFIRIYVWGSSYK